MADDPDPVVWDLRSLVTARDLGARNDVVFDVEGGTPLTVIFPSGRRLEGEWGSGAIAEAAIVGDDEPLAPLRTVVIQEAPVTSASELRAAWNRFEAEWGPLEPDEESPLPLIDEFEEFLASAGDDPNNNDFLAVGNNVRAYSAVEQDGVEPAWNIRFRFDDVTIRWTLHFEPATS